MFCNKCGKEIKEGKNFCPNCGNKVENNTSNLNNNQYNKYIDDFKIKSKEIISKIKTKYKSLNKKQQTTVILVPLIIICVVMGIYIGMNDTSSSKSSSNSRSSTSKNSNNSSTVTINSTDLNKISNGMTYSQVCSILGGKPLIETNKNGTLVCIWPTYSGTIATVYFNSSGLVIGKGN